MKSKKRILSALVLVGALGLIAGTAPAAMEQAPKDVMRPGVIYAGKIPGTNFCHLMYPSISMDTLFTTTPTLNEPRAGNLIDYYGRCDFDPVGPEAVRDQRNEFRRQMRDNS